MNFVHLVHRKMSEKRSKNFINRVARRLTKLLRHGALQQGLAVSEDGFVVLDDVLDLPFFANKSVTKEEIEHIVSIDNKKRYTLSVNAIGNSVIRCNQGHTMAEVKAESLLVPILDHTEVSVCIHGTYSHFLDTIYESGGLSRMTRNNIHMCAAEPTSETVISGIRGSVDVLVYVNVKKAMELGLPFFRSANNVILCPGPIPVDCFEKVVRDYSYKK